MPVVLARSEGHGELRSFLPPDSGRPWKSLSRRSRPDQAHDFVHGEQVSGAPDRRANWSESRQKGNRAGGQPGRTGNHQDHARLLEREAHLSELRVLLSGSSGPSRRPGSRRGSHRLRQDRLAGSGVPDRRGRRLCSASRSGGRLLQGRPSFSVRATLGLFPPRGRPREGARDTAR